MREDRAVERVIEFLETHLFGPGRREGLAQALEESGPERDLHQDEAERLRRELADVPVRIRRQMSHLEALEAGADAPPRSEAASVNWRRSRPAGSVSSSGRSGIGGKA